MVSLEASRFRLRMDKDWQNLPLPLFFKVGNEIWQKHENLEI